MNISKRTKLSLSQLISLFGDYEWQILMEKYNISSKGKCSHQMQINQIILRANNESIANLFEEIVRRIEDIRHGTWSPKYKFDIRWKELKLCLLLDGFKIENNIITSVEPTIEGNNPIEDDLTKELELSSLTESKDIIIHINRSAQSFLQLEPDYNGCLSNARIALETLVRAIAKNKGFIITNENKAWGSSLNHLKEISFINKKEEETIASLYTFVSEGSHIPLGFTQEEYTRFVRNLITSICYFISKLFTGSSA